MERAERATIGVGVVGAGFLAETRARCYARAAAVRGQIVAVTSRTPERAADFARRHGVPVVCATLAELLARPDVDVVDLCVPNRMHRPLAEAAARAGKHVVCTKPLAAYVGQDLGADADDARVAAVDRRQMLRVAVADAEAMAGAARAAGVRLMYGENWVYAPAITRASAMLAAGTGVILELRGWECHSGSHSPYSKSWRNAGGGALLRLAAHPIGAMLHLKRLEGLRRNGQPTLPVAVTAEVADLSRVRGLTAANTAVAGGFVDVETYGCVIIAFADGSRGVAIGGDHQLGGMESRLEILASDGRWQCALSPTDLLRAYAPRPGVFGDSYIMEKASTEVGWSTPMPDEDWTSGHQAMCEDFLAAVAHDRPASSDGALGVDVTRVIYSAYVSAAEGRRVALE